MAILKLDIPDGHSCNKCIFMLKPDLKEGGTHICKIFDCALGNRLTDIFKCPMCIEQSGNNGLLIRPNIGARTPMSEE